MVIDNAVSWTNRAAQPSMPNIEQAIDKVIIDAVSTSLAQIEKVAEERPKVSEKLEQQIRELSSSIAESSEKIRIKLMPNENLNLKWIDGKLVAVSEKDDQQVDVKVPKIDSSMSEDDTLLELDLLRRKLDDTERAMSKIIAKMGSLPIKGQVRLPFYFLLFCLSHLQSSFEF
jgi:TolA-binding protein